jgi:hypothetical protein
MKNISKYTKKIERGFLKLYRFLIIPKRKVQKIIEFINIIRGPYQKISLIYLDIKNEKLNREIESYYLYETLLYPPNIEKPHDTIN